MSSAVASGLTCRNVESVIPYLVMPPRSSGLSSNPASLAKISCTIWSEVIGMTLLERSIWAATVVAISGLYCVLLGWAGLVFPAGAAVCVYRRPLGRYVRAAATAVAAAARRIGSAQPESPGG